MNPADRQVGEVGEQRGDMGIGTVQTGHTGSGGDMLDKGVNFAEQKSGHQQKPSTTEKVWFLGICGTHSY